jgi:Mrp family chromosome partitioning ATPase
MSDVLEELSARYDVVLFDAPPTLPVADAAVLSAQCHGALFIGRYGKVTQDQVRAAAENLHRVSANVLGVILTMAPRSKRKSGYYHEYGRAVETITHVPAPRAADSTADSSADSRALRVPGPHGHDIVVVGPTRRGVRRRAARS